MEEISLFATDEFEEQKGVSLYESLSASPNPKPLSFQEL